MYHGSDMVARLKSLGLTTMSDPNAWVKKYKKFSKT